MSKSKPFIIAVDGHAAAGKGTLARNIAEHYDLAYLDSGKLYRLVAYEMMRSDMLPSIENASRTAKQLSRSIPFQKMNSPELTQDEVGKAASVIAAFPQVRAILKTMQRQFTEAPYSHDGERKIPRRGAVIDGRDMATVICPWAQVKLFITASAEVRAKRRMRDLGKNAQYETVLADLQQRDAADSTRTIAPLKRHKDATLIDTTDISIDEALRQCLRTIEQVGLAFAET